MSLFYQTLYKTVQKHFQKEALIEGGTRWVYSDFLAQVDKAASAFSAQGITAGDRVALMLYNQKELLVCFFALRKIGAIVVPVNIQMLPQDIAFVFQNAGARMIVVADGLYPHIQHVPLPMIVVGEAEGAPLTYNDFLAKGTAPVEVADSSEKDLAFLIYTSGTTGYPKGVMLSEHNVLVNIEGFRKVLSFTEVDRMVLALPLFHVYGLIVSLTGLFTGGTIALIPRFHPKKIVEAIVAEKATILPLVPTLFTVILDIIEKMGGIDTSNLRFSVSGGAALPKALLERIQSVLKAPVMEGYGLTETAPVLAVNDPRTGGIPGSVGKPLPNVKVRIVDEGGSEVDMGEIGEVQAKGENVMQGYYNLPDDTQKAFTKDGWFRTGDLGHLDAEGNLYISAGRIKDLIIKGGENISPLPIENALYAHPAVKEASVLGMPDAKLGEIIVACVTPKEGETLAAQDVLRHCREHLTGAHIPDEVIFLEDLPKNATGKVIKKVLKANLLERQASLS